MKLRCFIAIELPDDIKARIGAFIDNIRDPAADVKWVASRNLHLTLKFLGPTEEELIPLLNAGIEKILSSYSSFYIKIAGIGYFPDARRPRVIWLGVDDQARTPGLQKCVDSAASSLGFSPESREYAPHLTIGRVGSQRGIPALMTRMGKLEMSDFGTFLVDRVSIVRSDLKPSGPEYTTLAEIMLGRKED